MGEIRKDNLHESLIEELNELANIDLSGKQDKTDESLLTESKDVIGAINELFQSANNGKELIANAIGEPLSKDDTFSAMSSDINGLLSTFKTNMMRNGITVESGDKFKSLIDKIATLADSEGGNSMKYITGTFSSPFTTGQCRPGNYVCNINWDFTPSIVIVSIPTVNTDMGSNMLTNYLISNLESSKMTTSSYPPVKITSSITNISNSSFTISMTENDTSSSYYFKIPTNSILTYYAIGVGEEDTTLRDSLASILQEEGVEVTEEDDMASLIGKVDEEFDRQVVPAGNAVAANVDKGKTFINSTGQLVTGTSNKVTPVGTAVASDVRSGKTFINSTGKTITGTASISSVNLLAGTTITVTIPKKSTSTSYTIYHDIGKVPDMLTVNLSEVKILPQTGEDSIDVYCNVSLSSVFNNSSSTASLTIGDSNRALMYITNVSTATFTLNIIDDVNASKGARTYYIVVKSMHACY